MARLGFLSEQEPILVFSHNAAASLCLLMFEVWDRELEASRSINPRNVNGASAAAGLREHWHG